MTAELAGALAAEAAAFLDSLNDAQRARASFGFPADDQRRDWAYFPRDHAGLPLHDMDRPQQKRAHALIAAGLSLSAYARVTTIMGLESVLDLLEGGRAARFRDPGRYFVSVFGEPGSDAWGYRIEGHHVCLNYTVAGGVLLSATPIFLGANPASVKHGDLDVVRPCAEEDDLGRELLHSLDGEQRSVAVLTEVAPPDFVLANAPVVPETCFPGDVGSPPRVMQRIHDMSSEAMAALAFDQSAPTGISARQMNDSQRARFRRLVELYLERLPDDAATEELRDIDRFFDDLHFAWAGGDRRGEGSYYRIQGGTLLIEYDNTQDGANHVHAAWRDMKRDFGGDPLREHLARHHG